jgi:DNA modification methylase
MREDGSLDGAKTRPRANFHPTVKPIALMRYLVRLVTPAGGVVLDPFAGSGTTLVAAVLEGVRGVGIEMTEDYLPIIEGRLAWASEKPLTLL